MRAAIGSDRDIVAAAKDEDGHVADHPPDQLTLGKGGHRPSGRQSPGPSSCASPPRFAPTAW
ncbi:hypothetical protein PA7_28270 [Pseudonocardia asaccharolytica DSM 44247 = NBRC 16224]|uniref:Uncharacterized protein n=1 Tax=Pseudonocardia asaccharolytica DSM 44247 = NBRC 16224 TaxID=1123024 RepID=A0A511D2J3_9PSEU|nr:hypothetical protein PA7_28270 [Pseudonocardia asaccharolytica DSM 44247 = NBRC 16224]